MVCAASCAACTRPLVPPPGSTPMRRSRRCAALRRALLLGRLPCAQQQGWRSHHEWDAGTIAPTTKGQMAPEAKPSTRSGRTRPSAAHRRGAFPSWRFRGSCRRVESLLPLGAPAFVLAAAALLAAAAAALLATAAAAAAVLLLRAAARFVRGRGAQPRVTVCLDAGFQHLLSPRPQRTLLAPAPLGRRLVALLVCSALHGRRAPLAAQADHQCVAVSQQVHAVAAQHGIATHRCRQAGALLHTEAQVCAQLQGRERGCVSGSDGGGGGRARMQLCRSQTSLTSSRSSVIVSAPGGGAHLHAAAGDGKQVRQRCAPACNLTCASNAAVDKRSAAHQRR